MLIVYACFSIVKLGKHKTDHKPEKKLDSKGDDSHSNKNLGKGTKIVSGITRYAWLKWGVMDVCTPYSVTVVCTEYCAIYRNTRYFKIFCYYAIVLGHKEKLDKSEKSSRKAFLHDQIDFDHFVFSEEKQGKCAVAGKIHSLHVSHHPALLAGRLLQNLYFWYLGILNHRSKGMENRNLDIGI